MFLAQGLGSKLSLREVYISEILTTPRSVLQARASYITGAIELPFGSLHLLRGVCYKQDQVSKGYGSHRAIQQNPRRLQ